MSGTPSCRGSSRAVRGFRTEYLRGRPVYITPQSIRNLKLFRERWSGDLCVRLVLKAHTSIVQMISLRYFTKNVIVQPIAFEVSFLQSQINQQSSSLGLSGHVPL